MLLAALALGGCFGSTSQVEHFYALKVPASTTKAGTGPRLLVADFTAEAGYETDRMAYRLSEHELRFYGYHRWTASPTRLLTEAAARHLAATNKFAQVGQGDKMREPELVLDAVVEAIEEVDRGKSWQARLAMRLALRRAGTDTVLMRHTFDVSEPCKERHPREVARGVSKILNDQLKLLSGKIGKLGAAGKATAQSAEEDKDDEEDKKDAADKGGVKSGD